MLRTVVISRGFIVRGRREYLEASLPTKTGTVYCPGPGTEGSACIDSLMYTLLYASRAIPKLMALAPGVGLNSDF